MKLSAKAKSKKKALHWTLTFEVGMKVARPTFSRIVSAIENLQSEGEESNWFVLDANRSTGNLIGFMQTACVEPGLYIAEVSLHLGPDENDFGLWKAGRKEPVGAVVSQGKKGLFKTYENENLATEEVIAIAEHFYSEQKCHPDFQWRSLREDLKASA
jgi:hypothetical protein